MFMWIQTLAVSSGLAAISLTAVAGPLEKARIASDAKWIVHLDVEGMRNSTVGNYLIDQMLKPMLENIEPLKNANLSMNVSNLTSITAYGSSVDNGTDGGVLMVSTTADPKKDLDTVAGMFLLSAGTNSPFALEEKSPYPLYNFSKSVFFAPCQSTLVVAKSKDQIEKAQQLLLGKGESLAKGGSGFQDFREPPRSFLSVAVADGFLGRTTLPAQAQIIREATGGRLSLGERDKNVFLNLVFQGKDDVATTKIQQVLQGITALVSLSQQDQDITQLASGTRISSEGRSVTVSLEYPAEKTIEKIKEGSAHHEQARQPAKAKVKAKRKKHQDAKPEDKEAAQDEQPPSKELQADEKK